MRIEYINSNGEKISLMEHEVRVYKANFHSYSWEPVGYERRYGVRLDDLTKKPLELELQIAFKGENKKEELNNFYSITEYDVIHCKTGKLYWGDYYLNCLVIDSSTEPADEFSGAVRSVKVFAPYPFWIKEVRNRFFVKSEVAATTSSGYDNEYDYPYDYANVETQQAEIVNEEHTKADFTIIITGPATYPSIKIGTNVYELNIDVHVGEYLTIDSATKTAEITGINGQKVNVFPFRNLDHYLFEQIEPGLNEIFWNGNYEWSLTLYQTRSEPKWN